MLGQRVVTAIVLLACLLPTLFAASPWPFALLTLVMIAAAGWEWARLCQLGRVAAIASGAGLGAACAWAGEPYLLVSGPHGLVGDLCNECESHWPCDTYRLATGTYSDEPGEPS